MLDAEEKREKGSTLMFAGLTVWVGALLVLFFLPAARHGHRAGFVVILAALGTLGAVLMASGWRMRRGSSE
jgi:phosphatidylserine synthase